MTTAAPPTREAQMLTEDDARQKWP